MTRIRVAADHVPAGGNALTEEDAFEPSHTKHCKRPGVAVKIPRFLLQRRICYRHALGLMVRLHVRPEVADAFSTGQRHENVRESHGASEPHRRGSRWRGWFARAQ